MLDSDILQLIEMNPKQNDWSIGDIQMINMDGLQKGCVFFEQGQYKKAAKHIKEYLKQVEEKKPLVTYLLAESLQRVSKKKLQRP